MAQPHLDRSTSRSAVAGLLLLGIGVTMAAACLQNPRLTPTIAFSAIVAATIVERIHKDDLVFAGLYAMLFVYTVFSQIAYLIYPEDVVIQAPGLYAGEAAFHGYLAFVAGAFLLTWLLRLTLHRIPVLISAGARQGRPRQLTVAIVLGIHTMSLVVTYVLIAPALSYDNQAPLKSNPVLAILYTLLPTVLLLLLALIRADKRPMWRVLFALDAILLLLFSVRAGDRLDLVSFMSASVYFAVARSGSGTTKNRVWRLLAAGVIIALTLAIASGIRAARADNPNGRSFLGKPAQFAAQPIQGLNPKGLVLQDYFVPSLGLVYSMHRSFVIPREVLTSNVVNAGILISTPSLGEILSRSADPSGKQGYAYYLFAEGYNVAGYAGIVYDALVVNLGLLLWEAFYRRSPSAAYRRLMEAVAFLGIIGVVRGQSSVFVSFAYTALLPAAVLFLLATGQRITRVTPGPPARKPSQGPQRRRHRGG